MSKRKLILAYVCLVGVPLTGLLSILRVGQRLSAPASVAGAWYVDSSLDTLPGDSCRHLLASVKQPFLSISQSGANLVFSLNNSQKTVLSGTIRGAALTMSADRSATSGPTGACTNPQAIRLDAAVDTQGGQAVLVGTLGIDGCPDCKPVQFHAVRQTTPAKEGL
ncbi:MAG TPA: hypothetical protein VG206_05920 [Terriglobia bacterium]|nr:hypothetical protein [Terriglobia bacterium]